MQSLKMKEEIEKMIHEELGSKIALAQQHSLIQNNRSYTEIEFTVDKKGQASVIETWDTMERLSKHYRSIDIPKDLQKYFVFDKMNFFVIKKM